MPLDMQRYQQRVGEVEQSARSLINSAVFYLSDPSLPDALENARRCLETAKYVLEGVYMPATPAESIQPLAHANEHRWPNGMIESWGFVNNADGDSDHLPYYHI